MPDGPGVEKVCWKGDGESKSKKEFSSVFNAPRFPRDACFSVCCGSTVGEFVPELPNILRNSPPLVELRLVGWANMLAVPYEDGDMYPCVVIFGMMDAIEGWSKTGQWPRCKWCQSLIHCVAIGGRDSAGEQLTDLTGRL